MSRIIITMDVDGEFADPDHSAGVTEAGYIAIEGALSEFGTDIVVKADR